MPAYNMTLLENQSNIVQIVQVANTYADGYLGLAILVTCYVVIFTWAKYRSNSLEAFTNTAFICSIIAIMLNTMEILLFRYTLALFIMTGIGVYALRNRPAMA